MSARRRLAVLVAAPALILGGCGGEAADREPPPRPPTSTTLLWRELGAWSGRGDRQTESFEIASGALRLTWSAGDAGDPGAGSLRVSLHSAISGRPLEVLVDHLGFGSDTVRLTAAPRIAYLFIESSGLDWRLGLEEGVAAGAGGEASATRRPPSP